MMLRLKCVPLGAPLPVEAFCAAATAVAVTAAAMAAARWNLRRMRPPSSRCPDPEKHQAPSATSRAPRGLLEPACLWAPHHYGPRATTCGVAARTPGRGVGLPAPRVTRHAWRRLVGYGTVTASWHTLLDVALRTSIVYLALLVGLRLTGTRQLGQMSTFDLVLLLIIANAVQNAMVGPDTSLAGGLVAAGVLIAWHRVIDWWKFRSRRLSRLLAGEGVMLIHNGKILAEHCARAGITRDELLQALREHGVARLDDVMLAVLEPDGMISVVRYDDIKAGDRPHGRIRAIRRNP